MPKPKPNETENQFMERCIPIVEGEGKPHDQAVAICISLWENKSKGDGMDLIKKFFESEIKAFNDETLTIEHFISTEQEDRSKDIVRANGMVMDGIPVVLKQHGFDVDTGHEPIAKPLSITVGTNAEGIKGIVAKTQYFDGSKLTPPDNTGERLYQKAKERFMPYFSIGFSAIDASPRPGGGVEFKKWRLNEYSQVGVPDNIGAEVVKTMEAEEIEEQANELLVYKVEKGNPNEGGTWKYCVCKACGHNEKHNAGEPCGKCPECGKQMQGSNEKVKKPKAKTTVEIAEALQIIGKYFDVSVEELEKTFEPPETKLKSIADRVAQDLPWEAMRTLWFGMLDELYTCDGTEKTVKAILKELMELITPFAVSFAQNTGGAETVQVKNLIESKNYINAEESPVVPAPDVPVNKDTSPVVIKLLPEPKPLKLPDGLTKENIAESIKGAVKDGVKKSLDEMRGKVNV